MKKKIVGILLCTAMVAGLLAGCGGGKEKEDTSKAKSDSGKPYAGEKLTVLYMSSVYADAAKSIVDEFESRQVRRWKWWISRIRRFMKRRFWI